MAMAYLPSSNTGKRAQWAYLFKKRNKHDLRAMRDGAVMTQRHCDPVTMDHIIELRKRVALLEKQLENALAWVTAKQREEAVARETLKEKE
jgi:hypothetical protein